MGGEAIFFTGRGEARPKIYGAEKIKNCGHFPCQNGGTCVPRNNSSSSNKYSCDCAQGYEGYNCDQQIDYCRELNKNCLNGGTCRSLFSSFVSVPGRISSRANCFYSER